MIRKGGLSLTNEPCEIRSLLNENGKVLTNDDGALYAIDPASSDGLVLAADNASDGGLTWMSVSGAAGVGDVVGPPLSTATALARFTDTSGKLLSNSTVLLSSGGAMTGVSSMQAGAVNSNLISSSAASSNVFLQATVTAESDRRIGITNAGEINLGSGSAAADLRIRRTGTSTLSLDNGAGGSATIAVDSITANTIGGKTVANVITAAASTGTANRITRWSANQVIKDSGVTLSDTNDISGVANLTVTTKVEVPDVHTSTVTVPAAGVLSLVSGGLDLNNEPLYNVGALQSGLTSIDVQDIVTGPISVTANAVPRYDGTTGKKIKGSTVTIDDLGNITGNLIGNASNASAVGGITVTGTPSAGQILKATSASAATWQTDSSNPGDVTGPGSSTNHAMVRFDGTSGKLIKGTGIVISDTDDIFGAGEVNCDNVLAFTYSSAGALLLLPNTAYPIQATLAGNTRGNYATDWQRSRGGNTQVASGTYSVLAGGTTNTASGYGSVISGGSSCEATSHFATIGGGEVNKVSGTLATIIGGSYNETRSNYSSILGGFNNKIAITGSGLGSVVVGGYNSSIVHDGCLVYNSTSTGSIATSAARQAIINLSTGAYSPPANDGRMFVNGDMVVTGSFSVGTLYTSLITPSTTNTSLTIAPTGTGALLASTTGDARGQYAVDLQIAKSLASQVAAGNYSTIAGGLENSIASTCHYTTICGGVDNVISAATHSTIVGGRGSRVGHGACLVYGGQVGATTTGTRQVLFNCGASMYTAPSTNPGVYTNGAITCAGLYVPPPSGGTSTALTDYENGTFNVTTGGAISGLSVQVKFQRIGKQVTLQIDAFAQNVTSAGTGVSLNTIPARFRPVTQFAAIIQTRNGDVPYVGHMQVGTGGAILMFNGPSGGDTWNVGGVACGTYSATTLSYMTA